MPTKINTTNILQVVVVGAGLGGLAAAIAISLAGHNVTILEAAPKLGEVGAGIQLTPNVTRLLRSWQVLEALEQRAVTPAGINFRRWQSGQVIGRTNLVPNFEQDFGAPYIVVHRAHFHEVLVKRAEELGVRIELDSRVIGLDFDKNIIETYNGRQFKGDLIVGCDGLKSSTRSLLLGAGNDPGCTASPYCAYRATVPIKNLQSNSETAKLVKVPELNIWIGERRHVMTYPINGGETFNLVLSHPAPIGEMPRQSLEDVLKEMKSNYEGWDPIICRIINEITETAKWQLLTYKMTSSWSHPSGKFLLMGDACHAMLPYMSQGAAQAIEDGAVLGKCLARVSQGMSLRDAVTAFESLRTGRATAVQEKSALNGRIWHYPDGADQVARDKGMAATLTNEHYIRSTNQWSDPATQIWLYNFDAERDADVQLDLWTSSRSRKIAVVGVGGAGNESCSSGIEDMVRNGLLAP